MFPAVDMTRGSRFYFLNISYYQTLFNTINLRFSSCVLCLTSQVSNLTSPLKFLRKISSQDQPNHHWGADQGGHRIDRQGLCTSGQLTDCITD